MSEPVVKWALACLARGRPPQLVALRMDGEKYVAACPVELSGMELDAPRSEVADLLRARMYVAQATARSLDTSGRRSVPVDDSFTLLGDAS
jgi:hypothetical protein